MKVTYAVKLGSKTCKEVETYPTLEATARGIQSRVLDPFSAEVEAVVEVVDRKGRLYDLDWSLCLMPRVA